MTIVDLRATLPRHATARWQPRSKPPDLICIHHSAAPSTVSTEAIARYHTAPPPNGKGRPAICYHYVVTEHGEVFQCNDDMAFTWHGHDGNSGLGVCLLGDFTEEAPPEPQLRATAALIAVLKERWNISRVIGHREAGRARTACPGDTWPQWRHRVEESAPMMYFRPRDDTGAGVHGGANAWHPLGNNDGLVPGILDEMRSMGLRWVKLLDTDGSSYNACRMVLQADMMPVVRLYRERPYPGRLTDKQRGAAKNLVALGVRYFERGNEPNLDWEWQAGHWPGHDWNAWTDATFRAIATDWIDDARYLAGLGALPAVDAMAPGGNYDDIMFLLRWFAAFKHLGATNLLRDHCWLSVHNAGLNHPLDYPDDLVNQREHPGQTIHTHFHRPGVPTGASNCIRKYEAVHKLFADAFGFEIPVLCTEGGFWVGNAADSRYPTLTVQTASEMQAAELRRMATAPSWLVAQMPWLWFNRLGANLHGDFERDAWKRVPGWGNCPGNEPAELPVVAMLKRDPIRVREAVTPPGPPPEPQPSPTTPTAATLERIRNHIWNAIADDVPVPYNPAAAFPTFARQQKLGAPLTGEHDVDGYRAQGYALAIVYAPIGQWADIKTLDY